ncbi:MAG TPA: PQQ-binding-like beta-propeller repeat protein [Chthoniobacteraceae bacterium]|nr:PQQ-binding-like beta-propeller repeat protein [Chthoniobacteraceae bacterium]
MSSRLLLAALLFACNLPARGDDWPQWRGVAGDGTTTESGFPTKWNGDTNVAWKTEISGRGHASLIVVGNRVLTVSAVKDTEERVLVCLDRGNGKVLWQQSIVKSPMERVHAENSHASSTPASDGERVFCSFLDGREVLVAAYDLNGKQLWTKRPGTFSSVHGFCSTPVLYRDTIIVNCDHDGDGYIVALARKDGAERWRIERPNKTRSYCAPLIRTVNGKDQMVLSGSKCIAAYDPASGKEMWMFDGPTDQFVASPVYHEKENLFFFTGGFPDHHLVAIRPGGSGNITNSDRIAWRSTRGVAYVPSPIAVGDWFFITDDRGFAHCFDAKNGEEKWEQRFGRQHASLVSADGLVYFLNDLGVCHVVRASSKFELISKNELGEPTYASPALSNGEIFIRSEKHIFCIRAATNIAR